jgi:hypothetical protein
LKVVHPYAKDKDASSSLDVEKIEGLQVKLYLKNHTGHETRSHVDYFLFLYNLRPSIIAKKILTTLKDVQAAS